MEDHHVIHESYGDYRLRKRHGSNVNLLFGGIVLIIFGIFTFIYGGLILIIIGGFLVWYSLRTNKDIENEKSFRRNTPITRISYD